ncbi:hypothetical protein ACH5RR_028210 [Cinchona calisaya]|uniref:Protein Jade-1 n=1 Tax=Cinchona calisaya TaxID=153742 RepID=A0ABD2YRX8_9GENT
MGNKFHDLPPLKRFKLIMQQQENQSDKENQFNLLAPSCLPTKKRKESREFPSIVSNSTVAAAAAATAATTYCLPAKKRVWALQEFDLNIEYQPDSDDAHKSQKESEVAKEIPGPNVDNSDSLEGVLGIDKFKEENEKLATEELNKENEETGVDVGDEDDDGIVCAICESTDGDPSDPIVFCDGCELMVHATCYGHPFTMGIPEGDWFCAKCLALDSQNTKQNKPFSCCLCPVAGGALKPTTEDGKWAHVVCAVFVPEVFFSDSEGREGIDISKVPAKRWKQKCYVCKSKNGCVIDCSEPKCPLAFHVTCGLKEDLSIEYTESRNKSDIVAGFCRSHSDLWKKQQRTGKYKIVARDKNEK